MGIPRLAFPSLYTYILFIFKEKYYSFGAELVNVRINMYAIF